MRASPAKRIRDTSTAVLARETALDEIDRWLTRLAAGPSSLYLLGEAGIGKTTVWLAALERARASGFQVLVSRPAEAETPMSFSALLDLCRDVTARMTSRCCPRPSYLRLRSSRFEEHPQRRSAPISRPS